MTMVRFTSIPTHRRPPHSSPSRDEEADIDEASISDGENTSTDTLLFSIDEGAGNAAVAANHAIPSIATMTEMSASSMAGASGCWRQRIPNMIITSSDEDNDEDDLDVPGWVGTRASMLRGRKRGNNASSGDERGQNQN